MTDDKKKKHDDKDRKKLSDEELEDVAGGQKIEGQIGKAESGIECKVPPKSAKKKGDDINDHRFLKSRRG